MRGFLSHPSDSKNWLKGAEAPLIDENLIPVRGGERERGLEGRIEMSPRSLTAALWSYNTGSPLSQMSAISNLPTATLTTVWIFNGSSLLFSFYTWRPPCLSFIRVSAVYGYTGIPLCPCHTLFRKVKPAQRRGEGVSVLFTAHSSTPSPRGPN